MRYRFVLLGALLCVAGCGEGPKHLPKADYQHGKAIFEMLEQYEKTSSIPFLELASHQIEAMNPERLDPQHIDKGMLVALVDYEDSLIARNLATGRLTIANFDEMEQKPDGPSVAEIMARKNEASHALEELEPIIKLCRDDAAQYFDKDAASTNTCNGELKAYRAKHVTPQ